MPYDDILLEAEEKMEKAVEVLREGLRGIRSGIATPGLVDGVRVEYYGTQTPIKQLANISCPDAKMILIKPFDPSCLGEVEKALQKANIGLTPNSDGKLIRLKVPDLSSERRQQLVGQVKEMSEKARVSIRNIRRDANKDSAKEEKDKLLSEDEARTLKDEIQELTKTYEKQVDQVLELKREEILEV